MEEQQNIIETFSEMAPRYEGLMNNELNRFWGITYEGFIGTLLDGIQTQPNEIILDIATGTAFIPSYLKKHRKPYKRIIGLDITYPMLQNANRNPALANSSAWLSLVCASAHELPLKAECIDRAICCLATHHMKADVLLSNIFRSLKSNGVAHLADAGSSNKWKNGLIRFFIKSACFMYFLFTENYTRAIAETEAIANIHTILEWKMFAENSGFKNVEIKEMKSKHFWAPNPIIIKIQKNGG